MTNGPYSIAASAGRRAAISLFFLLLGACSTIEKSHAGRMNWPKPRGEAIAEALNRKPGAPFPLDIGVYFVDQSFWNRVMAEREGAFEAFVDNIRFHGVIRHVTLLRGARGSDLESFRAAAAMHGVDAVFVVEHEIKFTASPSFLSLLYFTIVGLWLAPGHNAHVVVSAEGSLWDVRTGYLYGSAQGEGEEYARATFIGLSGGTTIRDMVALATAKAMASLQRDVIEELPRSVERARALNGG